MANIIGKAMLILGVDKKDFEKGLNSAKKIATKVVTSIGGALKKMAKVAAVAMAAVGAAIVGGLAYLSKVGSDAVEAENLFAVSMGRMADAARVWSQEMATALGVSEYATRRMVGVFNNMLKSMGLAETDAFNLSKQMTALAYDFASFYNMSVDEAFEKIQAGITGEIEPLKRLGIVLNVATVEQQALNDGITKSYQSMTEAEKVMVRFNALMAQSTAAQGDMARTANENANVLRRVKSQAEDLAKSIGVELQPAYAEVLQGIRSLVEKGGEWFKQNKDTVAGWASALAGFLSDVREKFEAWYSDVFEGTWSKVNGHWQYQTSQFAQTVEQWKNGLSAIKGALETVIHSFLVQEVIIPSTIAVFKLLFNVLGMIVALLNGEWSTATQHVIESLTQIGNIVKAWVIPGFRSWGDALQSLNSWFDSLISKLDNLTGRMNVFSRALSEIRGFAGQLFQFGTGTFNIGSVYDPANMFGNIGGGGGDNIQNTTNNSTRNLGPVKIEIKSDNPRESGNAVKQVLEAMERGGFNLGMAGVTP